MVNVKCITHAASVRSAPSTGANIVAYLSQGETAQVDIYVANSWLHVLSPHDGYVFSTSIQPVDVVTVPTGNTRNVITTTALKVRNGPGLSWAQVGLLPSGTQVAVYSDRDVRKDGYDWLQRPTPDPQWIAGDFTSNVGGPVTIPAPTNGSPTPPNQPQLPWSLPISAADRGVHGNAGGWPPAGNELALITHNNIKTVFIPAWEHPSNAISLYRGAGIQNFILRASVHGAPSSASDFIAQTLPLIKEYAAELPAPLLIQVCNEPNIVAEGLNKTWANGAEFASFYAQVLQAYRSALPGARFGFPALSPGGFVSGIREDEKQFASEAIAAIRMSDWVALHAYWAVSDGSDFAPEFSYWKQFGKPLIGTEIGPVAPAVVSSTSVLHAYDIMQAAGVPCMAWVLNGTGSFPEASWTIHQVQL